MFQAAVKVLLKEGTEVGLCDFGVPFYWKGEEEEKEGEIGRKEGRSEQAMGKKERALAKKASPTHRDRASRETTFYM